MSRSRSWLLICSTIALVVGAFLSARPARAIEPWRILVRLDGYVDSQIPGQDTWSPVFRSRRLNDGALARTQAASSANINLADQTSFKLGPSTVVEMSKFTLTPEGRTVVFQLRSGKVMADVSKALGFKQSRFEVQTPNGVLAARGTQFAVSVLPAASVPVLHKGKPSPRADVGNIDGIPMIAQTDATVTLVSVFEGTVVGTQGKSSFLFHAGDNAILGSFGVFVNPFNFPGGQVLPPNHLEHKSSLVHFTEGQSASYQDPAHQQAAQTIYDKIEVQISEASGPPLPETILGSTLTTGGNGIANSHNNQAGGSPPPIIPQGVVNNPNTAGAPPPGTNNDMTPPSSGPSSNKPATGSVILIIK